MKLLEVYKNFIVYKWVPIHVGHFWHDTKFQQQQQQQGSIEL